jgi:hypothetical protein
MATFYLLPPRASLDAALNDFLTKLIPGLSVPPGSWDLLADRLTSALNAEDEIYLIPRDDLPEDELPATSLMAGFGAEPGDRVVEVGAIARAIPTVRSWSLPQDAVSGLAVAR